MTVYLIGEPTASVVKIGFTDRPVTERLRQLRLGSPVDLVVRAHWDLPVEVEVSLHLRFADQRSHGEWFDFGNYDPVALVTAALGSTSLPVPDLGGPRRRPARALPSADELARRLTAHENSERPHLARELARVRSQAGLSTRRLGADLQVSGETVRRIERGLSTPRLPRVRQWLDVCGVLESQRAELIQLAERVVSETRPWRELARDPISSGAVS